MKLNYKSFGQGEPLIILHGLFGTLDNWQTIAKQLATEYTVYILDQRNHGRSPHFDRMDYTLMAEDLRDFLESNWIHKTHIMGHSMGGKTAMQFALSYPDIVDKLVVVDIAPKIYKGNHQEIFQALHNLDLKKIKNRKEADELLQPGIPDFGVRQFLLKNLSRSKDGPFQWKMNLPVIYKYYENILASVVPEYPFEGKTLFIRGGRSDYIQDKDLVEIRQLFSSAEFKTIEQSGHWIHAEAPTPFLNIVRSFLSSS